MYQGEFFFGMWGNSLSVVTRGGHRGCIAGLVLHVLQLKRRSARGGGGGERREGRKQNLAKWEEVLSMVDVGATLEEQKWDESSFQWGLDEGEYFLALI